MSPALVTERSSRQGQRRPWAGPWLRTRVFFSRLRLDRALARGADPSASPELGLRAEQLRRPRVRERIARGIDRVAEIAFGDPRRHLGPSMLPFRHHRLRPNVALFEELADALRSAGPHTVKGIAMASALLEDGRGALYANDPPERLGEALRATIAELDPRTEGELAISAQTSPDPERHRARAAA